MDLKDFSDYEFADISTGDTAEITKLEETISSSLNKDIVLIAYQAKEKVQD